MEKRFVQAATSDKDLETIAWKEIHPEFEDYSTALMKISKGLRKAVSSGKTKLESQELKDLVALTSAVIKTR